MCRSRRELSTKYLLANFGFDTAENEPWKVCPIERANRGHREGGLELLEVREALRRPRRLAKFRQNVARFRLYRLRFLQENMRFAAFFKIYQILKLKFLKFDKFKILQELQFFAEISRKLLFFQTDFLRKF